MFGVYNISISSEMEGLGYRLPVAKTRKFNRNDLSVVCTPKSHVISALTLKDQDERDWSLLEAGTILRCLLLIYCV
jgi:hypothetical protein